MRRRVTLGLLAAVLLIILFLSPLPNWAVAVVWGVVVVIGDLIQQRHRGRSQDVP